MQPLRWTMIQACLLAAALLTSAPARAQDSLASVVAQTQPKVVKIYGAGGVRGLEHYQSGVLISAEGHILTAWSHVLDSDELVVLMHDGQRYLAQLVGSDPALEIALVKVAGSDLPHFDLEQAKRLTVGTQVLAFSNLFNIATGDEPVSVQRGVVSAVTNLAARRGAFQSPYRGTVYVVDAVTNNPGAAGGVLTTRRGELAGLLGKELRSAQDTTWLNFAVPIEELRTSVADLLAGKARPRSQKETVRRPADPMTLELLGIVLVPDVLSKTPPYVDRVRPGSPAAKAGLRADDLIVFLNDATINSGQLLRDELQLIDRIDEVRLVVLRGNELIKVSLFADR